MDGAVCEHSVEEKMSYLNRVQEAGVVNIEMECAAMASLCHKVRTCTWTCTCTKMYIHVHVVLGLSPTRGSSFFLHVGKVTSCLGCAVFYCLVVCLTLFASFCLPSHLSLKHVY